METVDIYNVMLIYAYDTQNDGTELGPGSKQRLDTGIKYILESEHSDWVIILGAGMDPKKSQLLRPLNYLMRWYAVDSLADTYLCKRFEGNDVWGNGKHKLTIIQSTEDAWGSFDETDYALRTLKDYLRGRVGYYYAVSSDFHLSRVQMIWDAFGLSVKLIGTPWKPTRKEELLEPLKKFKVVLKAFYHWLKFGRVFD